VPSYTSSSNERIPVTRWGKVWIFAVLLFVVMLFAWEGFWRWQGFRRIPAPRDANQWALMRKDASRQGKKAIVLIGSSRVLTDIDVEAFAETTGVKPIQLGLSASSPLPILQNLAQDESFDGTVICDFHEVYIYASNPSNPEQVKASPDEFLKAYEERSFLENWLPTKLELESRKLLKETFVFQMKELSLSNVIRQAVRGRLPEKPEDPNTRVKNGRAIGSEVFEDSEIERLKKYFADVTIDFIRKGAMSPEKFPKLVEEVEQAVGKIQGRGGKVVLVCLPMSGRLLEINEQYFPKKQYWDVLAANTSAQTIHFTEHQSLAGYICDDDSHLDKNKAVTFTKSLVEILYYNYKNEQAEEKTK
jgi:hypothetical protein